MLTLLRAAALITSLALVGGCKIDPAQMGALPPGNLTASSAEDAHSAEWPVESAEWSSDIDSTEDSFLAQAQRHVAEREYRASENDQGLQAPNRRHNLRTYFDAAGIRVVDRTALDQSALFSLRLSTIGREGGTLRPVPPGRVSSEGARVEIARDGLVEWFVNSPEGLEQGFTLETRPQENGDLILALALEGATARSHGDRLRFSTQTGRKLEYGKLVAFDAAGRELASEMSAPSPTRLQLRVDDSGAAYPIVIDPLLTASDDAILESDQDDANLGKSIAGAGDVNGDGHADVIVGAPLYDAGETDEGAAFVFHGSPTGVADGTPATAAAQLESDQVGAQLGISVSSAGDVNGDGHADVIVGALFYDAGETDGGAAFVFHGSPTGVADGTPATAATRLESDQATARLGFSVSGAGDVDGDGYADVIVGAPAYDAAEPDEGAAFVFHGSPTGVADGTPATAAAQLESDQATAQLGFSVSGAGDVDGDGHADVIVGAPFYDAGEALEGAAFVFHGGAAGVADGNPSSAAAQLESDQLVALLGFSVSGAGDVDGDGHADVIVGAPGYDAGETDEGAAFVFHGSPTGIADGTPAIAAAQLESDQATAQLGTSVSGAGDVNGDGYTDVIVGTPFYDAAETDGGAAFVFHGSATGIADGTPAIAAARLESDQATAQLGLSVSGAGDVDGDGYADVIVGAPAYDATEPDEGAAFVFHGGAAGVADGNPSSAAAQLESDQDSGQLGFSVSAAGDVNGDGYADVIVGAPGYDAGETDEGAAFVFHGGATGIADGTPATAATQLESDQGAARFGRSVSDAGDVNGDGYADVIVGTDLYDAGETDEGAAFVFHGSPTGVADGTPATAAAQLESDQATAQLGQSVSGAGDVNGDGYADVIVGTPFYDAGEANEGAAFLFHGSVTGIADGTPATAAAQLEANQAAARFGRSVSDAGDVNGDGYADVIVGTYLYDAGGTNEGAAFVFHGSATGVADGNPTSAATQLESDQENARLGFSVSGAGDVNGDGYADIIVGAGRYDAADTDDGAAFVFHGSATGIADGTPATAAAQLESSQATAQLGYSVSGAGDVNGDGYADVIVGTPFYDAGEGNEGAAFVFHGSATGVADGTPATAAAQLESNQVVAQLGTSVSSAGDVNGDGFADVIVGALSYDAGETDEGAAFVFHGNTDGRPVLARQVSADGNAALIQPWGSAPDPDAFQIRMQATHPEGRGRVKLEVEACLPGVAFGSVVGCVTRQGASWVDTMTGSTGVELALTVDGLTTDELYRWRARVLHAPFSVGATGLTAPQSPSHGPWRRLSGETKEADIRLVPEPSGLLGLLSGLLLLRRLQGSRGRRASVIAPVERVVEFDVLRQALGPDRPIASGGGSGAQRVHVVECILDLLSVEARHVSAHARPAGGCRGRAWGARTPRMPAARGSFPRRRRGRERPPRRRISGRAGPLVGPDVRLWA